MSALLESLRDGGKPPQEQVNEAWQKLREIIPDEDAVKLASVLTEKNYAKKRKMLMSFL